MNATSYAVPDTGLARDSEAVELERLADMIRREHDARTPEQADAVTAAAVARWRRRDRFPLRVFPDTGAA
jgi:hypothetical protein